MISSSHTKKEDAEPLKKDVNKRPVALTARKKPLAKHRLYLDVKNRVTANKLEVKVKELGGILELFLIKEVTDIITDREEWNNTKGGGCPPKTPQPATNELCSNESQGCSDFTATRGQPKTRADAMLERARRAPTHIAKDPLEQAKSWNITIWTIEKAFAWLEKLTISLEISDKKKNQKVFELKAPYIKFEAFDRQTRPVFQEIRYWPTLNFQGSNGDPGTTYRSHVERNMTRKTRSNHPRNDTAPQPGYCEVCRVEYPHLGEHLDSENHLSFIKDSSNFIELDSLISDTNIETFLKINCINNGVDNFNGITSINIPVTRNKMHRTRTISLCDRIKNSPLSPTGSDSGHRLRSRRHITMTNSYLGSTADDDGHPIKPEGAREIRELRSSTRQLLKLVEHDAKDTWDSGRPKRTCIKQKRISSDQRLVVDNRTYYKVEVLPNKLRSSGLSLRDIEASKRVQIPIHEDNEGDLDKALIVKFKRMRSSELKRLNNEAENFLFPNRDDSSSEDDVDADGPDTTASAREGDSTVISSDLEESVRVKSPTTPEDRHVDEASMDSNWSETSSVKKKKRRTHAEAFILDNQKYYKFETPGSRLRYQGSYLPSLANCVQSPKHNGEYTTNSKYEEKYVKKDKVPTKETTVKDKTVKGNLVKDKEKVATKEKVTAKEKSSAKEKDKVNQKEKGNIKEKVNAKDKTNVKEKVGIKEKSHTKEKVNVEEKIEKINLKDLQFSFERVPQSEPWYQTFKRQDLGREFYVSSSDSGCWKPFLLPYQMNPIPPLDPRICIKTYQHVKKQFTDTSSASTSAGCSTPDPNSSDTTPPEFHEECSKTSEDSDITLENRNDEEVSALDIEDTTRNRRRRGVVVGKNPRKSPRQHASTLAILSSLIHQRKRRGDLNKTKSSDLDSPKANLPPIPEVVEATQPSVSIESELDYNVLAKKLDDVLTHSLEGVEQLELSCEDASLISVNCKLNAIALLSDYDRLKDERAEVSTPVKQVLTVSKKPGRKKKKKNRTGWPNKSRRRKVKEEDVDDSTVDSLSVKAESDDIDNCYDENNSNMTDLSGDVNSIKSEIKLNNSVNSKFDMYNNIDQSKTQINVNNSLSTQTVLESENSCSVKQDRVRDSNKSDRVVDLDKWESAEKVLSAKLTNNEINNDIQFQPYVRVQKLDSDSTVRRSDSNRRLRSSSSPHRTVKKARRMPGSPQSPKMLRKPRGRWYRER